MYSISSLILTSLALTALVSSRPLGNNLYDLVTILTDFGVLLPWHGLPPNALKEVVTTLSNTSQTIPELQQKLILLEKKHEKTEQMEQYILHVTEIALEFKNKYDSILDNLVSVEKQYQEIINSKTMTIAEITEKVEEFEKQYPFELATLQCLFDKMIEEIRKKLRR
ncbi:unnamed protein product [Caenorhabditis brenneri]